MFQKMEVVILYDQVRKKQGALKEDSGDKNFILILQT